MERFPPPPVFSRTELVLISPRCIGFETHFIAYALLTSSRHHVSHPRDPLHHAMRALNDVLFIIYLPSWSPPTYPTPTPNPLLYQPNPPAPTSILSPRLHLHITSIILSLEFCSVSSTFITFSYPPTLDCSVPSYSLITHQLAALYPQRHYSTPLTLVNLTPMTTLLPVFSQPTSLYLTQPTQINHLLPFIPHHSYFCSHYIPPLTRNIPLCHLMLRPFAPNITYTTHILETINIYNTFSPFS